MRGTGTEQKADGGSLDGPGRSRWIAAHPATLALAGALAAAAVTAVVVASNGNPWWWGPAVAPMPGAALGWTFAASHREGVDPRTRRGYRLASAAGAAVLVALALAV
jgi:hypothetical protein